LQDWQAVEFGLPYVTVVTALEGKITTVLDAYGPHARVLAAYHVQDVHAAAAVVLGQFARDARALPQVAGAFEVSSVEDALRLFNRLVHYGCNSTPLTAQHRGLAVT
jgi:hypothetical protein